MEDRLSQPTVPLRAPQAVLTLDRLGAYMPSPLSFMRQFTRRAVDQNWAFSVAHWDVSDAGVGRAVLRIDTGGRVYSLIAFFHDLPDDMRSDRVIAEAWDATFTLFDGDPTTADLDRLQGNVPKQEAGRISERELTLSRANRSGRLWSHVVDALAAGRQPNASDIGRVGYIMRTTAVYGSGKFGAADRAVIEDRPECVAPFQVEMMTVYLIRWAVVLLVEHMAVAQGGDKAVTLDPELARGLGIGNSTGLGMAPFLINHPILFNNWITARETALARARTSTTISSADWALLGDLLDASRTKAAAWSSSDATQAQRDQTLAEDLARIAKHMERGPMGAQPLDVLWLWAANMVGSEAQEWLASTMPEVVPEAISDLGQTMHAPTGSMPAVEGRQTIGQLRQLIETQYAWALDIDWSEDTDNAQIWYTSEEKMEPRLARHDDLPGLDPYALPLAPARDVLRLHAATKEWADDTPVAALALARSDLRHIVRRVQVIARYPYGELCGNTVGADLRPVDMLRAKLAFFGAQRFDPRSDRWLRVALFSGAPMPEELSASSEAHWPFWVAPWEQ